MEEDTIAGMHSVADHPTFNPLEHNFRRRQAFKSEAGKQVPQRDEQFKNIERLKQDYHEQGNPVMSMDVKKKN